MAEIGDGQVILPFEVIGVAPVVVGICITGVQGNGFVVVGNRQFILLLDGVGVAPVVVSSRIIGVQGNSLAEVGYG